MTQAGPSTQATGNNLVFQDSVEVNAPLREVYRRWTDFQSFPQFMSNVEQVTPLGNNRYHWVARILGVKQEWDAVVTEMEPNRQIAWRSTSGPYNAGAVTFDPLGPNTTEVRVRMEYAPPAGKVGQTLLDLTQVTRREVHEDLENFKQEMQGGMTNNVAAGTLSTAANQAAQTVQQTTQQAAQQAQQLQQQYAPGIGGVLRPLGIPIAASIAGGVAAYFIGKNVRQTAAFKTYTSPVDLPNAVAGWALTGASAASTLGAAALRTRGDMERALFVGQWAPTLLGYATLARLLGDRRMTTNLPTSVASWSYVAGSAASGVWSAVLQAQGKHHQSRFVGQWVPTLLGAAIFTRLFSRLISR